MIVPNAGQSDHHDWYRKTGKAVTRMASILVAEAVASDRGVFGGGGVDLARQVAVLRSYPAGRRSYSHGW